MLDSIRSFFTERMTAPPDSAADENPHQAIQIAACALMLELAYADDEFTEPERAHLEAALQRHFDLSPDTTAELLAVADAERRRSVDLYQFTSLIAQHYDHAQKMVLLEAMWGLVYADGQVARHEAYLMKRVSKLLDVRAGFLNAARKRVEERD